MRELHVPLEIVFGGNILEILPNLRATGVVVGPIWISLPYKLAEKEITVSVALECVVTNAHVLTMAWDVAGTARVPILEPCATDVVVFLVYLECHVFQQTFGFVGEL